MKLVEDLRYKCKCYFGEVSLSGVLRVGLSDGTLANVLYRTSRALSEHHLGAAALAVSKVSQVINGCMIGQGASFDGGFVLMHPQGVVINSAVRGGRNITVESGVVLGAARNGLPVEAPVLGDNVFIGSGAKVLGAIKIGNNVKIGANAVVVKDVPDDVTVVGIPARVVGLDKQSRHADK